MTPKPKKKGPGLLGTAALAFAGVMLASAGAQAVVNALGRDLTIALAIAIAAVWWPLRRRRRKLEHLFAGEAPGTALRADWGRSGFGDWQRKLAGQKTRTVHVHTAGPFTCWWVWARFEWGHEHWDEGFIARIETILANVIGGTWKVRFDHRRGLMNAVRTAR